jgi:microcystin-dependent protein
MSFYRWSKSAGANAGADPSINWAEGQTPGSVNDSGRAMMAAAAKFRDDIGCAGTTTGTGAAYLLTTNQVLSAWQNGFSFTFIPHADNSAAPTISLDGLTAKPLRLTSGVNMSAAQLLTGTLRTASYVLATDEVLLQAPMDAAAYAMAAAIPTGAIYDFIGSVVPTGYVFLSGRTIGDASSGATERANADTSALFQLLWNSLPNTLAAVSGGRGANAAADYAAHKTITLPDARGRAVVGRDDMGGTAASRVTVGGSGVDGTVLGNYGGAETHTLTVAQLAQHGHGVNDPGHTHTYDTPTTHGYNTVGGSTSMYSYTPAPGTSGLAYTGISIQNTGSNAAHNNVQPALIANKIIKL